MLKLLGLPMTERGREAWEELVDRIKNPIDELTIHVVGKYTGLRGLVQEPERGARITAASRTG